MTNFLRSTLVCLVPLTMASAAVAADSCPSVSGKQMCVKFQYSTGNSNHRTAQFNADGTFTLPAWAGTTGTWRCAGGRGLIDVEYLFSGTESQGWYAVVAKGGDTLAGNGLAPVKGYMYRMTSVPGACAGGMDAAPPEQTQAE